MQQLQAIFWERNSDITLLAEEQKQLKKQDFQQRQRIRAQRQNWILKIIKTIKIFTNENKKNIYESVIRMMSYYKPVSASDDIDFDKNFTEQLINLFINFYSQCGYGDTSAIKKIIRPNNAFITIDLIKQLVETHRQYFKVKLLQTYKQAQKQIQEKSKIKLLPLVQSRRELPITQPSETQQNKKQGQDNLENHEKVKIAIFQKWQNFINYALLTQKALKEKFNDTYLQLLQRNNNNNFIINKFQQRCHGKSRAINYNISGLYTNQQIKRMQNKLKIDVKQKFANIKQLRGNPSAEQLREYFKIKIQIQDGYDKIESKKQNQATVNSWLPMVVQKSGLMHCPLNLFIIFAKEMVPVEEFQIKCGISMKNFYKMLLKNKVQQYKLAVELIELKNFKRHHFLDLNHAKKKQLMTQQHRVYQKSKKQSIFPLLRNNQLRQQTQIALKNRSLSQYKLVPLFKNEILNRKLDLMQNQTQQQSQSLQLARGQHQLKSTIIDNRSSSKQKIKDRWTERNENIKAGRSKIDSIIELIIHQRNFNLSAS